MRVLACRVPVVDTIGRSLVLSHTPEDEAADGERLAALASLLRPHLDAGETVVAVWPELDGEELHRHLQAVRAALDTTRLVLHPSPLPPLAVGLLAASLAELAGAVPDPVLASGVAHLERRVRGAAWLGSVAKLRQPAPSVGLHARSWLPSAAFGASVSVEHRELIRLKGDTPLPLPSLSPAGDWRMVVSDHGGDVEAVGRSFTVRAPDVDRLVVPPSPNSAVWWGTDKLVEVAIAPRGADRLRAALFDDRTPTRCAWCGDEVLADPCPLCGARADHRPSPDAAPGPAPDPVASAPRDDVPLSPGAHE